MDETKYINEHENNSKMKESSKNSSIINKNIKSQEISHKREKYKQNFGILLTSPNNRKNLYNLKTSVNEENKYNQKKYSINKNFFLKEKYSKNINNQNKYNYNIKVFNQSHRTLKSGNIIYRNKNLKFFNIMDNNKINKKKSHFILNNNLRPSTTDRIINKTRNRKQFSYNSKFSNIYQTFNKKNVKIYENETSEESSNTFYENRKNTEFDTRKRLFVNGREISNYEKYCYDFITEKLKKEKKDNKKKKKDIIIKFNEKVFSRNNQILIPCDILKKQLTASTDYNNSKTLKTILNSLNNSRANTINSCRNYFKKTNNSKILKKIIDLNDNLHEFKFYVLSDFINKEQKLDKKINDIENKLTPRDHQKLIIKNILYEKLDNKKKENDKDTNNSNNNESSINYLVSNFENKKSKDFCNFIERRFVDELKKIIKFNIKDSLLKGIFEQHDNYYISKQNDNKNEEDKIKIDRKNLLKNTKKIKKLAEVIYNKKMKMS